ncbi:hypothetical protein HMPREF3227_01241 [Corynebacterium sp. CMW7794]|nr:hypothetical protein HMPREF3227_01241 [Corynebacterium sp. CMW7794]
MEFKDQYWEGVLELADPLQRIGQILNGISRICTAAGNDFIRNARGTQLSEVFIRQST